MDSEKLQKVLARAGKGSRRQMEQWIEAGRIQINGEVAKIGARVNADDQIQIDGTLLRLNPDKQSTRVLIYHKPIGEICTRDDPQGRETVFSALPKLHNSRWVSVGRLDINTSGLLLFTNDGELANQLMHPRQQVEREYAVRVFGKLDDAKAQRMTRGVQLEDGVARFEHVVEAGGEGANRWYHVVVVAGRNRLVRRLWESQDLQVNRLTRVRYGPIVLPRALRQGKCSELSTKEIKELIDSVK